MARIMIKGYLFVILSAVIFGCNPLLVTFLREEGIHAFSLVLLRNFLSLPLLTFLAFHQNRTLRIPAKALPSMAAVGIMGCCLTPILLFSSYSYIASGTATVFHFIYPAAVVLAGVLVFKEKMSRRNLLSVIICVVGICLFYTPGQPLDWRGSALALISGITYAIYILQLSHFRFPQVTGFLFSLYVSLISGMIMLVVCLFTGNLTLPGSMSGWLYCFAFSVVINVCAVVMFQQGTFYIGGQKASILSTLEPITSIFVGAFAFQEMVGFQTAAGSALVILASILIALTDMKSADATY